jgi:hypothetical protein
VPGVISSQQSRVCTQVTRCIPVTRNSPSPVIPASSQVMLWEIMSWDRSLWGRLAGSNIYCAGTDPVDSCPKAEPREHRGLTLYTLASRLQMQEAKLNPHMATCDFIGYFISPVLCDFHISIFLKFNLSALPSPPPVWLSEHQPICFFSGLPFLATVTNEHSICLLSLTWNHP